MTNGLTSLADCNGLGSDPGAVGVPESVYIGAHNRLRAALGSASAHACIVGCGKRADDWALRTPSYGRGVSSDDPTDYQPMCSLCHVRFDRQDVEGVQAAEARLRAALIISNTRKREAATAVAEAFAAGIDQSDAQEVYTRRGGPLPASLHDKRKRLDTQLLEAAEAGSQHGLSRGGDGHRLSHDQVRLGPGSCLSTACVRPPPGPERPTCSCGAEAVRNGRKAGRQSWVCPRVRQTPSGRAAHAAAQARYHATEGGSEATKRETYARLKRRLGARIERKQARIAELEAEVQALTGIAARASAPRPSGGSSEAPAG